MGYPHLAVVNPAFPSNTLVGTGLNVRLPDLVDRIINKNDRFIGYDLTNSFRSKI